MEIPMELMLTISQKLPWMFFPDIVPVGHPIFDIINSTNPEVSYINIYSIYPGFYTYAMYNKNEQLIFIYRVIIIWSYF